MIANKIARKTSYTGRSLNILSHLHSERNFKRIRFHDIGSDERVSSYDENMKLFQSVYVNTSFKPNPKTKKNVTFGKDTFVPINRSSILDSTVAQIKHNPILINDNFTIGSNPEIGNNLMFLERSVVGKSFPKSFLLLKYKIPTEAFILLKNSIILSKEIFFFCK